MKVTAFIRETSAKNNITDQAHVYFRVRDGKTDIKAVSELSINPNHWSAERQGYKTRVALVAEAKRTAFDKAVQDLTALISAPFVAWRVLSFGSRKTERKAFSQRMSGTR